MTNPYGLWHVARSLLALVIMSIMITACAGSGAGNQEAAEAIEARSFTEQLGDQRIRSRIMAEILSDNELRHESNIKVTVFRGIALLSGEVPNREAGQRIAELAREDSEAAHVHNELVIAPLSSVFARARDNVINTTAKTRLLGIDEPPSLDPERFLVVTNRARIYLMGRVTQEEADAITEEVRRVRGVREVVRLFEYPD